MRFGIRFVLACTAILLVGAVVSFGQQEALAQDATMARLRVANYTIDAPGVTVRLDEQVITTEPLPFTAAAPHIDITAGVSTVTFGDGDTVIASISETFESGREYTAALIGQIADGSAQIVIIPETDMVGAVRDLDNPASYAILLHGISDGPAVDFSLDGQVLRTGITFGDYDIFPISQEPHDILVTFTDDPTAVLFENTGETPPADDLLLLTVMAGAYPDALDVTGAVSRLPDRSVVDFLRTARDAQGSGFDTLLDALDASGLSETLGTEGSFTLFAPTDAAFAALPAETRELLFAYPEALRAVLLGHMVDEVFVLRDMTDDVTVTTRAGTAVTLRSDGDSIRVNDDVALLFGGFPVVTNGNVIGIDRLLIPAASE